MSSTPRELAGHRDIPLGPSPFAATGPSVVVAVGYAVACLVWLVAGDRLPGGRWIVVHIFTLGVLTVLIWSFSQHFAARFTSTAPPTHGRRTQALLTVALAIAIASMLTGRAIEAHLPLVLGSAAIMAIVGVNLVGLRRLRRRAVGTRFTWVVRQYELAHVAFLAAAALGGALGAGWIPGQLFTAARNAHMHLNVLGWAGLTVMATLSGFGPALLRVQIEPGDDKRAGTAVSLAGFGLAVATVGFLVTSIGDGAGPPRVLAAGGLLVYGCAVAVVSRPLLRAARRTDRSPLRWAVAASLTWFLVAIATDVVVVATGANGGWAALGVMLLVGFLAQLVLTVLLYVAPMLRGRSFAARDRVIARVERLARIRTASLNLGVALVVVELALATGAIEAGVPLATVGWALVVGAVVVHVVVLAWPAGGGDGSVRSSTAGRYRRPPV